tara:strand:- start:95 stop:466 length:372 start_codon:yes stop_codon:yes gene_type:complete
MILPDHDTYSTYINSIDTMKDIDWGELQVRNSANFSINNKIITYLFGGINYQIEHHLFPTVCHIHYPAISKIVQETCNDFNIPYTSYNSIFSAISSTFYNLKCMNLENKLENKLEKKLENKLK